MRIRPRERVPSLPKGRKGEVLHQPPVARLQLHDGEVRPFHCVLGPPDRCIGDDGLRPLLPRDEEERRLSPTEATLRRRDSLLGRHDLSRDAEGGSGEGGTSVREGGRVPASPPRLWRRRKGKQPVRPLLGVPLDGRELCPRPVRDRSQAGEGLLQDRPPRVETPLQNAVHPKAAPRVQARRGEAVRVSSVRHSPPLHLQADRLERRLPRRVDHQPGTDLLRLHDDPFRSSPLLSLPPQGELPRRERLHARDEVRRLLRPSLRSNPLHEEEASRSARPRPDRKVGRSGVRREEGGQGGEEHPLGREEGEEEAPSGGEEEGKDENRWEREEEGGERRRIRRGGRGGGRLRCDGRGRGPRARPAKRGRRRTGEGGMEKRDEFKAEGEAGKGCTSKRQRFECQAVLPPFFRLTL